MESISLNLNQDVQDEEIDIIQSIDELHKMTEHGNELMFLHYIHNYSSYKSLADALGENKLREVLDKKEDGCLEYMDIPVSDEKVVTNFTYLLQEEIAYGKPNTYSLYGMFFHSVQNENLLSFLVAVDAYVQGFANIFEPHISYINVTGKENMRVYEVDDIRHGLYVLWCGVVEELVELSDSDLSLMMGALVHYFVHERGNPCIADTIEVMLLDIIEEGYSDLYTDRLLDELDVPHDKGIKYLATKILTVRGS